MRRTTVKKLNPGNVPELSIMKVTSPKSYNFGDQNELCGRLDALNPLDADQSSSTLFMVVLYVLITFQREKK